MTVDGIKESADGLFYSRGMAEYAAAQYQAEGRQTKIEESLFHPGQWVLHATPRPPEFKEPEPEAPIEAEPAAPIPAAPVDLKDPRNLTVYNSKAAAEAAVLQFQAHGYQTIIEPSTLHRGRYLVWATPLHEVSK